LFTNRYQAICSVVPARETFIQHISMHSYIKEFRDYKFENNLCIVLYCIAFKYLYNAPQQP